MGDLRGNYSRPRPKSWVSGLGVIRSFIVCHGHANSTNKATTRADQLQWRRISHDLDLYRVLNRWITFRQSIAELTIENKHRSLVIFKVRHHARRDRCGDGAVI